MLANRRQNTSSFGVSSHVSFGMFGQVITSHEAPAADAACEPLLSRVSALVAGQFVRSREHAATGLPAANERLLSCQSQSDGMTVVRNVISDELEQGLGAAGDSITDLCVI